MAPRLARHAFTRPVSIIRPAKAISIVSLVLALITGLIGITEMVTPHHSGAAADSRVQPMGVSHYHLPAAASLAHISRATHRHPSATHHCAHTYIVRPGDSLSSIAARCYGTPAAWVALYRGNQATIADPNLIYPGRKLVIPERVNLTRLTASGGPPQTPAAASTAATGTTAGSTSQTDGRYGCAALEALWKRAGGNPAAAGLAAEIATAESGGDPEAISPTDDYGLWQINFSNGDLATLNPLANARSAIYLSRDGTDWSAWTTYRDGAYAGRCSLGGEPR
jgi:LysM repeat protein